MPKIKLDDITLSYEQQGTGEPLLLIPYLAADNACYAFQVAEYAKRFRCICFDPRGTGASDKPAGPYTTQMLADDAAGLLAALEIEKAHVMGLSLGATTGLWLAARHPGRVKSLSLHGGWTRTDPFIETVVRGWQVMARALDNVTEMIVQAIFPWCLTPELYASKPEYIAQLAAFVRSRPRQPMDAFLSQSQAVITHDAIAALPRITAPTLITFGRHDMLTSTRFAPALTSGIKGSELVVFEECAHAPIYENVAEFNARTLDFLTRKAG